MTVQKTTEKDIEPVLALFDEARKTIAALGIDQWQNGYPNREAVLEDMANSGSYCIVDENGLCGTFAIIENGEPTYDIIIDGHWLSGDESNNYIALHRVAVSVQMRGKGVATEIVRFAVDCAKRLGRASVRIDTHKGNVVMRRMLEKNGFSLCGTIFLASGAPRVAYERLV